MSKLNRTKYVHVGKYVAEVTIELLDDDSGWAPYLSIEDANKLDDIRNALNCGDISSASKLSQVYTLQPVAVSQ